MSSAEQEVSRLLTEHFKYTPLTLIDDIINTVNELVYRAISAVETGLNSTPSTGLGFQKARAAASDSNPDTSVLSVSEIDEHGSSIYPEKQVEIETGVHKLETLLESSVDKNFDKFEIYVLRNILSVRDGLEKWVRLEHYQGLEFPSSLGGDEDLAAEGLLRKRKALCAARKLNASLVAEQRSNERLLSELQRLLLPRQALSASDFIGSNSTPTDHHQASANLSFLTNPNTRPGTTEDTGSQKGSPLTTQTRALLPLLPQLRALLAILHEANAKGVHPPPVGNSRAEGERRAYLEGAVRSGVGDGSGWNPGGNSNGLSYQGSATMRGDVAAIESIAAQAGSRQPASEDADMDDA